MRLHAFRLFRSPLVMTLLLVGSIGLFGQFDRESWFIGDETSNVGLVFVPGLSTPLENNQKTFIDLSESNAILSGVSIVQFYTNGETVINSVGQVMRNGRTLEGSSDAMYGSVITPNPAACEQYYLFYTQDSEDAPPRKLFYSIVDMSIEVVEPVFTTMGDVIPNQRNVDISPSNSDLGESLHIIKKSVPVMGSWLLASDRNTNSLLVFDVSATGIQLVRNIALSSLSPNLPNGAIRTIQFAHHIIDENMAMISLSPSGPNTDGTYPIGLIVFDRATGNIQIDSYSEVTTTARFTFGAAFSSDGSKFYYSDHLDRTLYQYDLNSGIRTLLGTASAGSRSGGLKLGPNDKIYWADQFTGSSASDKVSGLSVVENPNGIGLTANLNMNAIAFNSTSPPSQLGVFPEVVFEPLQPSVLVTSQPTCELTAGRAIVLIDEGLSPASFLWSTGATSEEINDVPAGTYEVTISTLNNCNFELTVEIERENTELLENINLESSPPSSCSSGDGTISITSPDMITDSTYQVTFMTSSMGTVVTDLIADQNGTLLIEDLMNGIFSNFEINADFLTCSTQLIEQVAFIGQLNEVYLGKDTIICNDDPLTLSALNTYDSYLWSNGSVAESITVFSTGRYILEVMDANGCSGSDTINVLFADQPEIDLAELIEIDAGDSTVLNPSIDTAQATNVEWSPPEGLSCTDCLNPSAMPTSSTEYFLEVTNENQCSNIDSILINVKSGILLSNVFAPESGNGNDQLSILAISDQVNTVQDIRIYNRWGELIRRKENFDPRTARRLWDGRYRNELVASGIYVIQITVELKDGTIIHDGADVLVIR